MKASAWQLLVGSLHKLFGLQVEGLRLPLSLVSLQVGLSVGVQWSVHKADVDLQIAVDRGIEDALNS